MGYVPNIHACATLLRLFFLRLENRNPYFFFTQKSTSLYMFMYPDTFPRLWPIHFAFLWLCGDSQHARLPALNYFPNILLFIASKFPVSYCVSVVFAAFCCQVKTAERISLAVLNLEQWNHTWWQMDVYLMFLAEIKIVF